MRFFRRLKPFAALSFDLDDTLYSNYPVMLATDRQMQAYFQQQLPEQRHYDYHYWLPYRQQVLQSTPLLKHDVGALREQSYYLGIKALGVNDQDAKFMAQQALAYFVSQRSNFAVPPAVHQLLKNLAAKWPIVAISNGNVDTNAIGIQHYFQHIYHADTAQRQKPYQDMFIKACQALAIEPAALLHVGDCGRSDIYGAISAGCQTAWVSTYDVGKPLSVLPNIELTDVVELARLI